MKSNNGPDVIVLPDDKDSSIRSFKQVIPVTIHHFYIIDEIGEPDRYLDLINILKTAEQHDTIFIYLNTPGGHLNTVVQIISAMKQSNATVITSIEGEVCSAGTLIFLSGNKYIINPNSTFMVHNYSGGVIGKGHEIASQSKYRGEYAKELMNDVYKDFLTQQEIDDVLNGKDIWLSSKDVIKRLNSKEKLLGEDVDIPAALSRFPQLLTKLIEEETAAKEQPEPVKEQAKEPEKKKPTKKKPLKK